MGSVTTRVPRSRFPLDQPKPITRPDTVAVEEPLEIRVGAVTVASTMRTPGDDFDLALGHLLTEGLVRSADQVARMMHCTDVDETGSPTYNVVDVTLTPGTTLIAPFPARPDRPGHACGVRGRDDIDDALAVARGSAYADGLAADPLTAAPADLVEMTETLRSQQKVFATTGGAHAAGIFAADGTLLQVREDVGRHNAVDKVIGAAARDPDLGLPLASRVLVVSSRAGFEIVAKAVAAGVPILATASAATSLAVDLAVASGLTLIGFAGRSGISAYSRPDRILTQV